MIVQTAVYLENPYRLLVAGQWIRSYTSKVWHHGIVTGFGWDHITNRRVPLVTHNRPGCGIMETSLQEFSDKAIEIFRQPVSVEHGERVAAIARFNQGQPYALFNQNCEHFASYCFQGRAESVQVQGFVAALSVVGLAALVMTSDRS